MISRYLGLSDSQSEKLHPSLRLLPFPFLLTFPLSRNWSILPNTELSCITSSSSTSLSPASSPDSSLLFLQSKASASSKSFLSLLSSIVADLSSSLSSDRRLHSSWIMLRRSSNWRRFTLVLCRLLSSVSLLAAYSLSLELRESSLDRGGGAFPPVPRDSRYLESISLFSGAAT